MFVKGFDNLEEMEKYYNKDTNTYVFKENGSYIDLVMLNFDLKVSAHIDAGNIIANDINAYNVDAINIDARNINAWDIKAYDIKADNIKSYDIKADDIIANNIDACDIKARNIKTNNIFYRTVCVAYESIKCRSIKGFYPNSKHFVLEGELEIESEQ